ncbi:MAG: STAS domain-containing protein [Anaerolineales bacterium]|nr:STAS domain-containing protein [Anaerolineales bacterium]
MATKALEATVRQQGAVAVIDLRGEIDSFGEEALNNAYAEAERRNPSAVLLNFAAVEYINSTGIALIVGLLARARKSARRLLTTGLSSHYVEIFTITRLADFMNIYPDEASALAQA